MFQGWGRGGSSVPVSRDTEQKLIECLYGARVYDEWIKMHSFIHCSQDALALDLTATKSITPKKEVKEREEEVKQLMGVQKAEDERSKSHT